MRIDSRDAINELLYWQATSIKCSPAAGKHSLHVSAERYDENSDNYQKRQELKQVRDVQEPSRSRGLSKDRSTTAGREQYSAELSVFANVDRLCALRRWYATSSGDREVRAHSHLLEYRVTCLLLRTASD